MAKLRNNSLTTVPLTGEVHESFPVSKPVLLTICLLLVVVSYMGMRLHRSFFHDDAYITLRYANQWQAGNGPVWNSEERVEGYTSFLHLATLYPMQKAGLQPEVSARIIGLCSYLAIWLTIILYSYRSILNPSHKLTTMLILLSTFPTTFTTIAWSLGGLEPPLFTLLLMITTYLFATYDDTITSSQAIAIGFLLALCTLTRPEAILFVAVTSSAGILLHKSWKATLIILLTFSMLYVPYFLWRWSYYGDFFPNTYYAKLGTPLSKRIQDGFYYLHTFVRSAPWIPLIALISWLYTLLKQPDQRTKGWKYMTALSLAATIYVVWTGGDHMPAYRFWTPFIPIFAWLIAHAWASNISSPGLKQRALLLTVLMTVSMSQFFIGDTRMKKAQRPDPAGVIGKQIGEYISDNLPHGSTIATNSAGAVAYIAPNQAFIDMLGLNDSVIAKRDPVPLRTHWQQFPGHGKGDGKYVL